MPKHYDRLIIDGNNFLFRAFYIKRPERTINGVNVAPIQQFLTMLKTSVNRFRPTEIVLTWDKKLNPGKKNFRKDLVAYKEQRVENEKTVQLFASIEHLQKFIDNLGIKTVYPSCMEADDVVRYLTLDDKLQTIVVSSDQDLLQLVRENVNVYLPNKDLVVDDHNFESIVLVRKEIFLLYKCIMGDVSDNIIGLEKFGKVRAKALAEKLFVNGKIDFTDSGLSEEQIAIINRNMLCVDLRQTEITCPEEYESYREQEKVIKTFNSDILKDLFTDYEMPALLKSFGEWNNLFNRDKDMNDILSFMVM